MTLSRPLKPTLYALGAVAVAAVAAYSQTGSAPAYPPQDISGDVAHAVTSVVAGNIIQIERSGLASLFGSRALLCAAR